MSAFFFLLFNCLWAKSQSAFISENKTVKFILPTSICEVTIVK